MNVTTAWRDEVLVASLTGELDTIEQDALSGALEELKSTPAKGVVLDCAGMRYIASLGLSILLQFAKDLRAKKIPLRMAAPAAAIRTVLDTVQLGAVIPIDATVEEAVKKVLAVRETVGV